jgi:hypothetical protein
MNVLGDVAQFLQFSFLNVIIILSGDVVEIYHFSLEDERPQKGETAKAAKIIKCWVVSLLDFIFESNFNL